MTGDVMLYVFKERQVTNYKNVYLNKNAMKSTHGERFPALYSHC